MTGAIRQFILLLAVVFLTPTCRSADANQGSGAAAGSSPTPAAEAIAVEAFLASYADSALAQYDTAAIRRRLADDFAILEDSVWYDVNGYLALMAAFPGTIGGPFSLTYHRSDFRTTVEDSHAWTSFVNRATLEVADSVRTRLKLPAGIPLTRRWRETVVLRRSTEGWKIVRWHSSPAP